MFISLFSAIKIASLVLIFIEITLTKNNINSKIFLCCVTVSLLVIYEFYTNSSSLKENFISIDLSSCFNKLIVSLIILSTSLSLASNSSAS